MDGFFVYITYARIKPMANFSRRVWILIFGLIAFCNIIDAQVTYFSREATNYTVEAEGLTPIRQPDGNFFLLGTEEGSLKIIVTNDNGAAFKEYTATPPAPLYLFGAVDAKWSSDSLSILFSTMASTGFMEFAYGRIQLSPLSVTMTHYRSFRPYRFNSPLIEGSDGLYAVFPDWGHGSILKFDDSLNLQWSKRFLPSDLDTTSDKHPSMGLMLDDTTLVISCKDSASLALAKFSTKGKLLSYHHYSSPYYSRIHSVSKLSDGSTFLAGYDMFAAKLDSVGNPLWANLYPLGGLSGPQFTSAIQLDDGRILAFVSENGLDYLSQLGHCILNSDGTMVGCYIRPSTYQMGPSWIEGDVLFSAGVIYTDKVAVFEKTRLDLLGACSSLDRFPMSFSAMLFPPTSIDTNEIEVWDGPGSAVPITLTFSSRVISSGPICMLVNAPQAFQESNHAIVYPNPLPRSERLQVETEETGRYMVMIIDELGRIHHESELLGTKCALEVPESLGQIFFLSIQDEIGNQTIHKVVRDQ